jgi:O-antigen/teichoic acid export membrane protein
MTSVMLVLSVVLVGILRLGLTWAILGYALGPVVGSAFAICTVRDQVRITTKVFSSTLLTRSLRFGMVAGMAAMANYLVYRVNQAVLGYLVSEEQIGYFGIASGIAERVMLIPASIGIALLPRLTHNLADSQQHVPRIYRISLIVSFAGAAAMAVAGVPAILFLYGPKYVSSIVPFLIMLPGIAIQGAAGVLASYLLARKKPYYGILNGAAVIAANVVLNLLLIPWLGIAGAALASVGSFGVGALAATSFYRREAKVGVLELLPRMSDVRQVWQVAMDTLRSLWRRVKGAPAAS